MSIDTKEKLEQLEKVEKIPIYIAELKNQNISEDLKFKDFISRINDVYYATGYIYNISRFSQRGWVIKDDCGRSVDIKKSTIRINFYKKI